MKWKYFKVYLIIEERLLWLKFIDIDTNSCWFSHNLFCSKFTYVKMLEYLIIQQKNWTFGIFVDFFTEIECVAIEHRYVIEKLKEEEEKWFGFFYVKFQLFFIEKKLYLIWKWKLCWNVNIISFLEISKMFCITLTTVVFVVYFDDSVNFSKQTLCSLRIFRHIASGDVMIFICECNTK